MLPPIMPQAEAAGRPRRRLGGAPRSGVATPPGTALEGPGCRARGGGGEGAPFVEPSSTSWLLWRQRPSGCRSPIPALGHRLVMAHRSRFGLLQPTPCFRASTLVVATTSRASSQTTATAHRSSTSPRRIRPFGMSRNQLRPLHRDVANKALQASPGVSISSAEISSTITIYPLYVYVPHNFRLSQSHPLAQQRPYEGTGHNTSKNY